MQITVDCVNECMISIRLNIEIIEKNSGSDLLADQIKVFEARTYIKENQEHINAFAPMINNPRYYIELNLKKNQSK